MVGNKKHPSNNEFVGWYNNSCFYNCVQLDPYTTFRTQTYASKAVDNWVWGATGGTGVLTETTRHENPLCADPANGDVRLLAFSPAIDSGEHFDTFKSMWWYVGSDMDLAPIRISAAGKLTPGCYQGAGGFPSAVVVSAPGGGLLVNGEGAAATNLVEAGETFTAVLSGDPEADRWCMGVSVDGEESLFDAWPGSLELSLEYSTSPITVTALYSTNWYVDAVNGSDTNRGFTAATAKKTLAEVFTNCAVAAGDVVNVLPGTYGEGAMKRDEADTVFARAVVPAEVVLRSTSGAANTVIMGGELTRCLFLGEKARAEGLTLTGGRVQTASDAVDMDRYGGGVRGSAWSDSQTASLPTVTDCIISNNIAFRAGGGAYARFVKCRFHDNWGMNDNMSAAGYGTFHHCIVDGNFGGSALMYPYEVYNCTLGPKNYKTDGRTLTSDLYFYGSAYKVKTFNSIVFNPANDSGYYSNCVLGSDNKKVTDANKGEGSILTNSASIAVGDDYRPLPGSPAIDMGVPGIGYEGDEWFPEFDIGGVPRVMNGGRFDVGAMEYDWRPRYAKDMGGGVCVTDVSSNVVEVAGKVVVPEGWLGLDWVRRGAGRFGFTVEVSGGGTLTVSANGDILSEVQASDGAKDFTFKSALATNRLEFAFSGDGGAVLSKFTRGTGVIIVIQ